MWHSSKVEGVGWLVRSPSWRAPRWTSECWWRSLTLRTVSLRFALYARSERVAGYDEYTSSTNFIPFSLTPATQHWPPSTEPRVSSARAHLTDSHPSSSACPAAVRAQGRTPRSRRGPPPRPHSTATTGVTAAKRTTPLAAPAAPRLPPVDSPLPPAAVHGVQAMGRTQATPTVGCAAPPACDSAPTGRRPARPTPHPPPAPSGRAHRAETCPSADAARPCAGSCGAHHPGSAFTACSWASASSNSRCRSSTRPFS